MLYGHMLCTCDLSRWHFFYFSERDLEEIGTHWKGAGGHPHIHFVNYLWPGLSAQSVWNRFSNDKSMAFGALHIRLRLLDDDWLPPPVTEFP